MSQAAITGPRKTINNSRPISSDKPLCLDVCSPLLSRSGQCDTIVPTMKIIPFTNVVRRLITIPFPIFNYKFTGFNYSPYSDQPSTPKVMELPSPPKLPRNKHLPKPPLTSKLSDRNPTLSPKISDNKLFKMITCHSNRMSSLESEATNSNSCINELYIKNSKLTESAELKTEITNISKKIENLRKT